MALFEAGVAVDAGVAPGVAASAIVLVALLSGKTVKPQPMNVDQCRDIFQSKDGGSSSPVLDVEIMSAKPSRNLASPAERAVHL